MKPRHWCTLYLLFVVLQLPGYWSLGEPILSWDALQKQGEAEAVLTITTGDEGLLEQNGPALDLLIATCRELSALAPQ